MLNANQLNADHCISDDYCIICTFFKSCTVEANAEVSCIIVIRLMHFVSRVITEFCTYR